MVAAVMALVVSTGCADQDPPCGVLPGNQEARDRACSDSDSPQFHLAASECDASYLSPGFAPAWCEVGCTPAASETGAACSNASNPFSRTTFNCAATHESNGEVGCCVVAPSGMLTDPVWGTSHDAVMFFSCP